MEKCTGGTGWEGEEGAAYVGEGGEGRTKEGDGGQEAPPRAQGGRRHRTLTLELLDHGQHVVGVLVVQPVPDQVLLLLSARPWGNYQQASPRWQPLVLSLYPPSGSSHPTPLLPPARLLPPRPPGRAPGPS